MRLILFTITLSLFISCQPNEQKKQKEVKKQTDAIALLSGPMLGYNTMKEVAVWLQTNDSAKSQIIYWNSKNPDAKYKSSILNTGSDIAFARTHLLTNLEPGETYNYKILLDGSEIESDRKYTFTTQKLWHYREDPPTFSFVAGSCLYDNDSAYDRPGKPYGKGYKVFKYVPKYDPEFFLWLGDNNYLREADWNSRTGILYRYTHMRTAPELKNIWSTMHHYAIWDDHDYGPNDSNHSFWNKEISEEVFNKFWANPNTNLTNEGGITGTFIWNDCQFFLMDDRYFRGPKYADEPLLGKAQIDWLVDALKYSRANFKFVAIGGQVLNTAAVHENYINWKQEYDYLLSELEDKKINGVIFITGDRHHSEISKMERKDAYPLYDITSSPLGSTAYDASEEANSRRIDGSMVSTQNFAVFNVSGPFKDRSLTVTFVDAEGEERFKYSIKAKELKY